MNLFFCCFVLVNAFARFGEICTKSTVCNVVALHMTCIGLHVWAGARRSAVIAECCVISSVSLSRQVPLNAGFGIQNKTRIQRKRVWGGLHVVLCSVQENRLNNARHMLDQLCPTTRLIKLIALVMSALFQCAIVKSVHIITIEQNCFICLNMTTVGVST